MDGRGLGHGRRGHDGFKKEPWMVLVPSSGRWPRLVAIRGSCSGSQWFLLAAVGAGMTAVVDGRNGLWVWGARSSIAGATPGK